ncbi:hypothetical protein [Oceanobacillus sp. FSL H7-0719]|uniref:hypothetical protein n=1 Tax=Oceanobacillus sp. FSL H7-0719 TaxID=2954507 RepID=UPI00324C3C2C
MTPRWLTDRNYKNSTHETLQVITVYAPGENKELVKKENKKWTHRRELVLVEK